MYRAHFINYKTWRFGWSGPLDHVLFWSMSHQICLKLPHRVSGTYKLSFPSGFEFGAWLTITPSVGVDRTGWQLYMSHVRSIRRGFSKLLYNELSLPYVKPFGGWLTIKCTSELGLLVYFSVKVHEIPTQCPHYTQAELPSHLSDATSAHPTLTWAGSYWDERSNLG